MRFKTIFSIFVLCFFIYINGYNSPDFYNSMNVGNHIGRSGNNDPLWNKARLLYEQNWLNNLSNDISKIRIPKIIHHIWIGSPFPEKYKKLQETWINLHPDWEHKLWTDTEIKQLGLVNQSAYDLAPNFGQKADIARYEILYRYGGLYVDTDFECLHSFDIIHASCNFYTGITGSSSVLAFNGLIGATPGHPILKQCIESLSVSGTKDSQAILGQTGPQYFTRCIKNIINSPECGIIILFPMSYFYPWPWWERDHNQRNQILNWIRPESFAIHHWHVSWNGGKAP